MGRLILAFLEVALHRRSPADLPPSAFLLYLALGTDLVLSLVALRLQYTLWSAIGQLVLDTVLFVGTVGILLKSVRRPRRLPQTLTAYFGVTAVQNALALPLFVWLRGADAAARTEVPEILVLLLFFWNVDVGGWILAKALDKPYVMGVSIMVVYVLTSIALREALFFVAA